MSDISDLSETRKVVDANSFYGVRALFARVADSLENADELKNDLTLDSEVWDGCTVEQLIEGIIEAEHMHDSEEAALRDELGPPDQRDQRDDETEGTGV